MVKFLNLNKQYQSIRQEIDKAIKNVIRESAFVGGRYVSIFEEKFANYSGNKFCVSVANGTDALEIAIKSLDLPANSEIIVPANTFIASSEAVTNMGYKVRFCDNSHNYTIDIEDLKKQISSNVSAIMVVHLYGHPCNMDEIIEIAKSNNLKIIEDCSQAHGAKYKGRNVGTFGDIATYSFYPGKNLGAFGDGGAITTDNQQLADKCRMIANHGSNTKYLHLLEGRNSRLDGINAAILSVKLNHLDKWNEIRNIAASFYSNHLSDCNEIILPVTEEWAYNVFHIYPIRAQNRDNLIKYLNDNEIQTGIHYPIALPNQPAYQYIKQDCSYMNATKWDKELISLPMGDHLTSEDAKAVILKIYEYYEKGLDNQKL